MHAKIKAQMKAFPVVSDEGYGRNDRQAMDPMKFRVQVMQNEVQRLRTAIGQRSSQHKFFFADECTYDSMYLSIYLCNFNLQLLYRRR